jgi:hypothetical protein
MNKPAGLNIPAEAWEKAIVAIGKANVAGASQSQIMAVLTKAGLTPQEAKEVWAAYDVLTDSRLSAICDRELARVGLAKARYEVLDDSEIVIAEADSLSDARYAAEKAEKSGQRRVMIYDNQTGKTVAFSSKVESTRLARVGLAREDCDKCGKPNPKWKEQNFCDKCREGHLKQIADAKAQQTVGVDKQYLKPSLSAICDRELQRVGLAAGDSGGMTYTVHFHSADDKKWFIKKAKLVSNEYDDLGQMAIKVDHGIASIAKNSPHVYSVE